jgi:hypothetical protein
MSNYTKDDIMQKRLLMLLPFYIMRYEHQTNEFENDPQKLEVLLAEYEDILRQIQLKLTEDGRAELYSDLVVMIRRIADYIFRGKEKVQKGLGDIMGGKVLQLESERLRAEGEAKGEANLGKLIAILLENGKTEDASLAATNPEARKRMYAEYGIGSFES